MQFCYLCAVCGGNRSRNETVRVGVSPISPIWRLNGCQMITVNFGVSGPKFTKFLRDVDREGIRGVNASIRFPILPSIMEFESQEGRRFAD